MRLNIFLPFFLTFFFNINNTYSEWKVIETGIKDDFNAIWIWGDKGVLTGNKGIYYCEDKGRSQNSWKRFNNFLANPDDSSLYRSCRFNKIASDYKNTAYICGTDTVNNNAVIFYINLDDKTCKPAYIGKRHTRLNDICFNSLGKYFVAVGDSGLIIKGALNTFKLYKSATIKNLNSIKADNKGNLYSGGEGVIVKARSIDTSIDFTVMEYPTKNFKTIALPNTLTDYFAGGKTLYRFSFSFDDLNEMNYYDYGNLNANCSYFYGNYLYIGTDHGIFRSASTYGVFSLEHQVASGKNFVSDIFVFNDYDFPTYATSNAGKILVSTGDNPTKPLAFLNLKEACQNAIMNFSGIPGTGTICEWYIDGEKVSNNCFFNKTFSNSGAYKIKYIVTNSFSLSDTAYQTILIIPAPNINLPVTTSDNLLCKNEKIVVGIKNSQNNFTYRFKNFKASGDFGYAIGNNDSISFKTKDIDVTGNYYINVQSSLTGCEKNFTDTIKIKVEETKAVLFSGYINTQLSEKVNFYNHSKEAQNCSWSFLNKNPSIAQSFDKNPSGVTFADTGYATVKLVVWSDNQCYDTLIQNGPYVYVEPVLEDPCWIDNTEGIEAEWAGYHPPYIEAMKVNNDNSFLISGGYKKQKFHSRYGVAHGLSEAGGYLAKYSKNGALKWILHSYLYNSYLRTSLEAINAVATNENGNIFVFARAEPYSIFVFPNGDTLMSKYYEEGVIMKLDSNGNRLWHATLTTGRDGKLKLDKSNNIILTGYFDNPLTYTQGSKKIKLFENLNYPNTNGLRKEYIIKLSPEGNFIWANYLDNESDNKIVDLGFDKFNNYYVTGIFRYSIFLSSIDTAKSKKLGLPNDYLKLYLVKYDSSGNLLWTIIGHNTNMYNMGTYPSDLETDAEGNAYVTGTNGVFNSQYTFEVLHPDNTNRISSVGGYFLMKISPEGITKWIVGNKNSYYGNSSALHVSGNDVLVSGKISNYSGPYWNGFLTSADENHSSFTILDKEFFLAKYDTLGNLIWAKTSGIINASYQNEVRNLYIDNSKKIFLTGVIGYPSNLYEKNTLFCSELNTYGVDGFYGKITQQSDVVTNITEPNEVNIDIFPNPVKSLISIRSNIEFKNTQISIFNFIGQKVYETSSNRSAIDIDIEKYFPGLYIIQFKEEDKIILQKKFLKE